MKNLVEKQIVVADINQPQYEYKGNKLRKVPEDFTSIFIFTTGINIDEDEIVRVCLNKFRKGKSISCFDCTIKPIKATIQYGYQCGFLQNSVDVISHSQSFKELSKEIWDFLQGEVLVGAYPCYDLSFLNKAFVDTLGKELTNDYIDIIEIFNLEFDDFNANSLYTIYDDGWFYEEGYDQLRTACNFIAELAVNAFDYKPKNSESDNSVYAIKGNHFIFTGALKKYKRKEIEDIVKSYGGVIDADVKMATNFLVIGGFKGLSSRKSSKIERAEEFITKGRARIKLISEDAFFKLFPELL